MKKIRSSLLWIALCMLYAALVLLAAQALIRCAGSLFALAAPLIDLPEKDAAYAIQILSQLRTAVLVSPWAVALVLGAISGLFIFMLIRRKKRLTVLLLFILLFFPLTLTALLFTLVNDVRVIALLHALLPLAGSLF